MAFLVRYFLIYWLLLVRRSISIHDTLFSFARNISNILEIHVIATFYWILCTEKNLIIILNGKIYWLLLFVAHISVVMWLYVCWDLLNYHSLRIIIAIYILKSGTLQVVSEIGFLSGFKWFEQIWILLQSTDLKLV